MLAAAVLLGRRGLLLAKVAREMQREAAARWGTDQEWFRKRARKAAEQRATERTASEGRGKDEDNPG